jgi:hypothetical protein
MTTTIHPTSTPRRLVLTIGLCLAAAAALMAVPASGEAGVKFGAKLANGADPVQVASPCPGGAGEACSRAPIYYEDPPHAGGGATAPKDGVIDKIKLIAGTPGSFRLQLARVKGQIAPQLKLKAVGKGPKISYFGTGEIEKFNVNVPVKQGWRLGMRTKYTSALECEPGIHEEIMVQPALSVGDPFADGNWFSGCTHLVQAVME